MRDDEHGGSEWRIIEGDATERLRELDAGSVQTCVTSPPYWGLRDYGSEGQLGLEPTPEEYVANLVAVFREVRRVLRDDGTVWLNLGDSYAANRSYQVSDTKHLAHDFGGSNAATVPPGLKPKDLVGIPWRVAFALQADGWWLRSDIVWAKPNPMPESVTDRPTRSHEYVFLLTKSARYFYDAEAIREEAQYAGPNGAQHSPYGQGFTRRSDKQAEIGAQRVKGGDRFSGFNGSGRGHDLTRNRRSVWTVATQPFPGAHFATFPPKLIEPCVLATSAPGDLVLDPFAGSGTTGLVALRHDRSFVGVELSPEYAEMARNRIRDDAPLLNVGIESPTHPSPESQEGP